MANSQVETVRTTGDKLLLALAGLLGIAGVMAFYALEQQALHVRVAAIVAVLGIAAFIVFISPTGKGFIAFAKDAYREVGKVVWPTRQGATQMTAIVFVFAIVMALYLWVSDKTIEWAVFSLILGWK